MNSPTLPRYRWYGRILESELALAGRLHEVGGEPVLSLRTIEAIDEGNGVQIYQSSGLLEEEPWLRAFRRGNYVRLQLKGVACFDVAAGGIYYQLKGGTVGEAEIFFLGLVSTLWLEQAGATCLHGSAVVLPGGAVGFLGFNRAGKSSLAACFLDAGFLLLTDDVLAVDIDGTGGVLAQPSFPQMRLWPSAAEEFVENAHQLEPVHPDFDKLRVPVGGNGLGAFHDSAAELGALFLPVREGSNIEITRLTPREATIELVRHSFLGALGEAAIGVARRFERLVAVAERVPVFRLVYPNGLEHLPEVREAILERLATL